MNDTTERENVVAYFNKYRYEDLITGDATIDKPVFHYTTISTLLTILKNKQLRFSNRLYLNDYSEGQYALDICTQNIDDIWPESCRYDKGRFTKELSTVSEQLRHKLFAIYQLSLSTDGDNLSMWNYYAKGNGANIRFSLPKLVEYFASQFSPEAQWPVGYLHGPTIYDRDKQIEILRKILRDFSEPDPQEDEWYLFTSWAILYVGTFFKHPGFRNECEYRIAFNPFFAPYKPEQCLTIQSKIREEPYYVNVYQKGNMLVPYIDVDFDAEAVEGIVLSPRTGRDIVADGLQIAMRKDGFDTGKVTIENSKIPVRF